MDLLRNERSRPRRLPMAAREVDGWKNNGVLEEGTCASRHEAQRGEEALNVAVKRAVKRQARHASVRAGSHVHASRVRRRTSLLGGARRADTELRRRLDQQERNGRKRARPESDGGVAETRGHRRRRGEHPAARPR